MKIRMLGALLCLALAGCGAKKFDASTEEARRDSVERMKQELPEAERSRFDRALMIVAMDGVSLDDLPRSGAAADTALSGLDGKTAAEIMREADAIVAAREAKAREQALQEIAELEQKAEAAVAAREQLARFTVNRSRFYLHQDRYSFRPDPVIELALTNGTDQAVARVFATGTIASPGRSIPWLKEDFNFSISGGIEPGEDYTTSLNPNMFSDWGEVRPPADAVFTVEIVELRNGNDEPFLSARGLAEHEQARLQELKAQFQ